MDITEYSSSELSMIVFNDEGLYLNRHQTGFVDGLSEFINFTDDQKQELINDLAEDLEES